MSLSLVREIRFFTYKEYSFFPSLPLYCCCSYFSCVFKMAMTLFKTIEKGVLLSTNSQALTKTYFLCLLRNILCVVATKSLLMSRNIASIASS